MAVDQKQMVLIVDDEAQLRKLSGLVLTRTGYDVLTAGSGEEALTVSRGHPGPIHLLLSDVEMEGMTGIDLGRQIVAERPTTRVLLNSANLAFAEQNEFPFLAKPFSAEEMRNAVAKAIESVAISATVAQPKPAELPVHDTVTAPKVHRRRLPQAAPVWTAAAGIVLAVSFWGLYQRPLPRPETVDLKAMRGSVGQAEVEARKPLVLKLDPAGLPHFDSYRIEVADGTGQIVWRKTISPQGSAIVTESAGLHPGIYFVRVYSPAGELLREYGLRAGKKH